MADARSIIIGYSGWQDIQLLSPVLEKAEINIVSLVSNATELVDQAREYEVDCILFTPTLPGMTPGQIQELLVDEPHGIAAVGLIPAGSQYAPEYQRHGMKGFVTTPLDATQVQRLPDLIRDAVHRAAEERRSRAFTPLTAEDALAVLDKGGWQQQSIAVFSPKGGVGKSTLAVNLAVALGVIGQRMTLLIDGDMSRANSHIFLGWQIEDAPFKQLAALYSNVLTRGKPTETYVVSAQTLRKHTRPYPGKLSVLPGIPNMRRAGEEEIAGYPQRTMDIFQDILREARGAYEFRVVDVGPDYNLPIHWATLNYVDTVFIVVTPERTALQDVKHLIPDLEDAFDSLTRFRLVLNGFHDDFGIRSKEVLNYLEHKIPLAGQLHWQPNEARRAINLGEPLVLQRPLPPLGRDLIDLATTLYPPLASLGRKRDTKKQPGFFKRVAGALAEF